MKLVHISCDYDGSVHDHTLPSSRYGRGCGRGLGHGRGYGRRRSYESHSSSSSSSDLTYRRHAGHRKSGRVSTIVVSGCPTLEPVDKTK